MMSTKQSTCNREKKKRVEKACHSKKKTNQIFRFFWQIIEHVNISIRTLRDQVKE